MILGEVVLVGQGHLLERDQLNVVATIFLQLGE